MRRIKDLALRVGSPEYQYVKKVIKAKGKQRDRKCRLVRGTFVIDGFDPPIRP